MSIHWLVPDIELLHLEMDRRCDCRYSESDDCLELIVIEALPVIQLRKW